MIRFIMKHQNTISIGMVFIAIQIIGWHHILVH